MVLIVCVDDRMGLSFNNRRLSSDKAVIEDMLRILENEKILISKYSFSLFKGSEDRVCVSESLFDNKDAVYFAESGNFAEIAHEVERLIIYNWNRLYPSDCKFPMETFTDIMTRKSILEFEGTSHACITREEFVR